MSLLKDPHDEARARIIWGESWVDVHHWLIMEGGITEEEADEVIKKVRSERAFEIRRSGLRSMRTGGLMLLGSIILLSAMSVSRVWGKAAPIAVGLLLFGTYKLLRGGIRLLSGRAEGSLTEMD